MPIVTLPEFTKEGVLPPGDYSLSLDEIRSSFLTSERQHNPLWDHRWRGGLVDNLAVLAGQLWQVGVTDIFVDGSFVEDKDHPNDIDGYFVCERKRLMTGELQRELNLLDPYKVWTWSPTARMAAPGFTKRQLPMWHRYRIELWPHVGLSSGIRDEHGNEQEFPAAFRKARHDYKPKGIIKLVRK
jgi:hypothetical protein